MPKAKRMYASPTGHRRVVEEREEIQFAEEEEEAQNEQRQGDGRYSRADLDKIRKIHFLVTQLFQSLGVPSVPTFAVQPPHPWSYQSGYSYAPMGREQERGPRPLWGMSSGVPAWSASPFNSPVVSPQPQQYVAAYPTWNLFPGTTVAVGSV